MHTDNSEFERLVDQASEEAYKEIKQPIESQLSKMRRLREYSEFVTRKELEKLN